MSITKRLNHIKKYGIKMILSFFIVFSLLLPFPAHSVFLYQNASLLQDTTLLFDDGKIKIELYKTHTDLRSSITGTKRYTYNTGGNDIWSAALNASFHYDGTTALCLSADCTFASYNSQYSLSTKVVNLVHNTAIAEISVTRKILGITISTGTYYITLSCDAVGNLS